MNAWVIFRRARIVLFSFLVLLCLTWATLFAVFLAHEWSHFSGYQKIVIVCLLSLYGFTAILLYLMAVVLFRLWWDVARVVSLLVVHAGSSVVFTMYRPNLPCRGFHTEAFCKDFVFTIFVGCWVFSGMILCFSITLGIMAFLPRPMESEEIDFPPSPASFKAGSPSDEERPPSFHSFDSPMGSPYDDKSGFVDESLSAAGTPVLVNGVPQEPPRLWQSYQTQRSRNRTDDITGTASSVYPDAKSGHQKADSLYLNPFSARSPPPPPVYTPASETGHEFPSVMLSTPSQLPALPEPIYGARAVTSNSMHHDRAAPYTPTTYTDLSPNSFPATFRGSHQPRHMYPDLLQTAIPRVYSFHSTTASVHSKWAVSPSHTLTLTPGVAHPRHPSEFFHSQDIPRGTSTLKRNVSEPNRTVLDHGGGLARRSPDLVPVTLSVNGSSLQRRGSDGQLVDHAQWQRLVLGAAAKP